MWPLIDGKCPIDRHSDRLTEADQKRGEHADHPIAKVSVSHAWIVSADSCPTQQTACRQVRIARMTA
jgi:hypothetical protein